MKHIVHNPVDDSGRLVEDNCEIVRVYSTTKMPWGRKGRWPGQTGPDH
jgi:hypothetical protein